MPVFDLLHEIGQVDHLVLLCKHLVAIIFEDIVDDFEYIADILFEMVVVVDG